MATGTLPDPALPTSSRCNRTAALPSELDASTRGLIRRLAG
jgi:hypothetical protein